MVPSQDHNPISLMPGQSLYSPTGAFRLNLDANTGDLAIQVISDGDLLALVWRLVFSFSTGDKSVQRCDMQIDGNLVVYNPQGVALWASGTYGNEFASCRMQDDGNFVIYREDGSAAWASDTPAGYHFSRD